MIAAEFDHRLDDAFFIDTSEAIGSFAEGETPLHETMEEVAVFFTKAVEIVLQKRIEDTEKYALFYSLLQLYRGELYFLERAFLDSRLGSQVPVFLQDKIDAIDDAIGVLNVLEDEDNVCGEDILLEDALVTLGIKNN